MDLRYTQTRHASHATGRLRPVSNCKRLSVECPSSLAPQKEAEASSATSPTVVKASSLMEAITLQENRAKVDLEAFLLEFGPLKEVSGGKGKGPRRVLTLTVADSQMLVQVALWSPVAEKSERTITEAFENVSGADQYPKLRFTNLERVVVCREPGLVVKFQSTRATTVSLSPAGQLRINPAPELVLSRFRGLNVPDVNANLMGVFYSNFPLFSHCFT